MKLTSEQIAIINSTGDIKINAVAGSGKTTTIIEYARTRPKESRILYLAFNKSVKLEALKKFADKGLNNVKVETAHSLAYKNIVYSHGYTVRAMGYKTQEIAELLHLTGNGEKHAEFILANHISKFIALFCNSDKLKVQDLNYLETINDAKAHAFVKLNYRYIELQTRKLLGKMDKGEIEITHDFYLKKFQLSEPNLFFDYILFDEGQDASPAMLDIFFKQSATKVIVGDTHQQIYGWRFAVNSLEKADFKTYHLSHSFRFNQPLANLALGVLQWKNYISDYHPISISGNGNSKNNKVKAVLARTNLGLLLNAIEYVTENKNVKRIYFEGNINSYTYADEGASLYDVLNLDNGNRHMIRDPLIKSMKDLDDLEDYIKKTEDMQLGMMLEIVKEYGNEIPGILKTIKSKHVENDDKAKAEMIFSTVHRCKGMEYDEVHLVNDFITEEKVENKSEEADGFSRAKIIEEINLLYVAVTRTRNLLHIPESLMPKDFPTAANIDIIKVKMPDNPLEQESSYKQKSSYSKYPKKSVVNDTKYSYDEARQKNSAAYKSWTAKLDEELTLKYCEGAGISEMAKHFGRTKGAIILRIKKLELEELYG